MSANVVRQDVVQITFDIENPFQDLIDEMNELKKKAGVAVDSVEDDFVDLNKTVKSVQKELSGINKLKFTSLKSSLTNTLNKIKTAVKNVGTGLKNVAKVGFTKLKSGLLKVKGYLTDIAKKASGAALSGLKKMAGVSFKALGVGLAAATAAVASLVSKSVSAYADFEQLKGGVETLFGAKGAKSVEEYAKLTGKSVDKVQTEYDKLVKAENTVIKNANNAYKTAGLSANEYMETATSFSASLISGLKGDTEKAASYADKAITDMSDNANKMGTDIGSIQYAYQGFAKQNYTMLDNLKLGFGGSAGEMARLINESKVLGKTTKVNAKTVKNVPFDKIIEAIHVTQEKLGITGTTSKEAAFTISGSLNSMKSAWGNLMPALIQGGDQFDQCVKNLVESIVGVEDETGKRVGGVINNLKPAIESALKGVGTLIQELSPIIAEQFPQLAKDLLPPLIKAALELVKGFIKALPTILSVLIKEIPNILKMISDAFSETFGFKIPGLETFANYIKENAESISQVAPKILGAIGAFVALKKVLPIILGLFSKGSGGKGGFLSNLGKQFAALGKTNTGLVAKGMANIAIIVGGMTLLTAVCVGIMTLVSKITDFTSMLKMVGIIGAVGAVGAALAKFAGVVGVIPISVVLKGLAAIALVMGGVTAIIVAFGALTKIEGFTDFLQKGGDVLTTIFNIIGKIGGSLIGGLGEGITNSLPTIGKNISDFAESLKPMFTTFSNVGDMSGLSTFLKAIADFMLKMAANDIASLFTGGTNLTQLATDLSAFAEGSTTFFKKVAELPANGFTNATNLFNSLAGLSSLPKEGGVKGWFSGEINYTNIANGLAAMATESVMNFFKSVASLKQASFDNAKKLFDCLAGLKSLPKDGGVVGWFMGDINYENIASGLGSLSSEGVKNFFTMVGGLKKNAFENTTALFQSLANMGDLPKEGGWWQKLTGTETSTIGNIATELSSFAEKTQPFFDQIEKVNLEKVNGLWESLQKSKDVTASVSKVVDEHIKDMVSSISELPNLMAEGLKSAGSALADAMVSIWENAAKASAKPVNKIIAGANWIMQEFGSSKRVASWTPYANGTNGHKGGNALVNDGRGAELVQMPNGSTFIPQGRNVFIPNAPKGMKVLPAENTAQLMGKSSPTFRYAKGTGKLDIWNYIDNPSGLISAMKEKFVSYKDISGLGLHIGKAMVSTVSGEMTPWAKKLYDEFGVLSLANYDPSKGVQQWRSTVIRALKMEGLYSEANVKRTLFQMQTESGGNPRAINLWDSNAKKGIPSKGLMQVIDPTFKAYARAGFNKNIYDPLSNILASIRYAVSRYGSLARAYRGVGYADGGIATRPSIFGEAGAEMAIPLTANKRKRGIELWLQAGDILGVYTPEQNSTLSSYSPEGNNTAGGNRTVNNTYNPTFVLNMNGASATDTNKRKVKKWITEAITETFDSMGRTNPLLTEV